MTTQYIKKTDMVTVYYKDSAMTILHREDGPAIEHRCGVKSWYLNDRRVKHKEWWIDGIEYTHEEFLELTNPQAITLSMDQIAAAFGVDAANLKITK